MKKNVILIQMPEGAKYLKNAAAFGRLHKKYQSDDCYIRTQPARYPCHMIVAHIVPAEVSHNEVVPVYLYEPPFKSDEKTVQTVIAASIAALFIGLALFGAADNKTPPAAPGPDPDNDNDVPAQDPEPVG